MNKAIKIREERLNKIINVTQELFSKQGIEQTSFQEIADKSKIGVASVYRYYENKTNLAVEAAINIWDKWYKLIANANPKGKNGLEKISNLIDVALSFFKSNPEFLNFVDNFDNYIANLPEMPERMQEYEDAIYKHRPIIYEIIQEGLDDGSINKNLPVNQTVNTTIHSFLALAQKLYLRGNIIPNDKNTCPETELGIMKDMVINHIKAINDNA